MALRAVVCAYSSVGTAALEGLLEAGIEVSALYTYAQGPDEAWFEPPQRHAESRGIPTFQEPDFNADSVYQRLRSQPFDFLFSFYFREMIQARVLELPGRGAYNLHGSLLPRYRGRAPLNWVLIHGEKETGITLHAMTPKPDDGDIIAQAPLPLAWDETALSLTLRAAEAARPLMREGALALATGTASRIPQKGLGPSSYFGGRRPADSRLDFAMDAQEAFNQVRAVTDPWPNAFLEGPLGPLKVAWALPSPTPCPAGHFRDTHEGVLLGFRQGALRLIHLKYHGEASLRPTDHAQWLRQVGIPEAP